MRPGLNVGLGDGAYSAAWYIPRTTSGAILTSLDAVLGKIAGKGAGK